VSRRFSFAISAAALSSPNKKGRPDERPFQLHRFRDVEEDLCVEHDLFRKPVPTPDPVEGRLFGVMLYAE
jgi:hypothetical protein